MLQYCLVVGTFVCAALAVAGCAGGSQDPAGEPVAESRQAICSGATLTSSPYQTAAPGTTVTWTAGASCQLADPVFDFWVQDPTTGTWSDASGYTTANTFSWVVPEDVPGATYYWQVWVREAGSGVAYETWAGSSITVYLPANCSAVSTTASPAGTVTPGTVVTLTSDAAGCASPAYELWHLPPGGTWEMLLPYSPSATYAWDSTSAAEGFHAFQVWAREAGSGSAYDAWDQFTVRVSTGTDPSVSTTASPAESAEAAERVTFTSSATGYVSPVYEVWHQPPGGAWEQLQPYSTASTYVWQTKCAQAGTHFFQVWVQEEGAATAYDAYDMFTYDIRKHGKGQHHDCDGP